MGPQATFVFSLKYEAHALRKQVGNTRSQSCRVNRRIVCLVSRELMDILPDNLLSILAPGSCIVITSRCDEYVLPDCAVHDLALLSSSEARLVFCHHAGIDKLSMETALKDTNLPEEQEDWRKRITAVVTKCSGEPSFGITRCCLPEFATQAPFHKRTRRMHAP